MRKVFILLLGIFLFSPLFAEKIPLRTGDVLGLSLTDYFFPLDISVTGSKCSVTSIKNVEKDLWCISIAAWRSWNTSAPVIFEYYVKKGDIIKLRRLNNPLEECNLKVESVNWNEAVLVIQ